jgi:4-amino-4-deoxy-L-arabinose transferase-like glycosyltransferase
MALRAPLWQVNGILAGRLLNLVLSFAMICLIVFPLAQKGKSGVLAACGLLIFPYYLWLSSHLYTDIIATFFVFLGFWLYLRNQHVWSSLAFILGSVLKALDPP